MVDIAQKQSKTAATPEPDAAERRPLPRWAITLASVVGMLVLWEIFGRDVNPVFGSYPSAIAVAFWELLLTGQLWSALLESLQPFFVGYGLAIVIGVPVGLIIGRFRTAEAAFGIYITAGYAMPLVALVPLLILWLGLGFKVKVAVVFLMSLFPICINTWLGVTAVPKTLDRGRQVVRGAEFRHSPPHHPARHAALHHGRHPPGGRPRRGGDGDRGILHHHLGAGRGDHQFRQ